MEENKKNMILMAAKAAGIIIEWYDDPRYDSAFYTKIGQKSKRWNPFEYDHDLIGLARKIKITIDYFQCCAWHVGEKENEMHRKYWGNGHDSKNDAEAIMELAASIGEKMP